MDPEHARKLLARERERVQAALGGLGPVGADADADTDAFEAAGAAPRIVETGLDEAVADSLREELAAIERAEQRLAEGSYGRSVVSGEPIPDARLEAMPWVERTVAEQARYEQGG